MKKNALALYILKNASIDEPELSMVLAYFKFRKIKHGSILLKQGEVENEFHYISKGCFRTYYIDYGGHVKTRHITFEDSLVLSLTSFITREVSFEYVEALENSEIYTITRKDFFDLLGKIPKWKDFYLKILEKGYVLQNKKIETSVTLSASDRYQLLFKESPHYIRRLSNIVLASYLDISPETLSRIKTRLKAGHAPSTPVAGKQKSQ